MTVGRSKEEVVAKKPQYRVPEGGSKQKNQEVRRNRSISFDPASRGEKDSRQGHSVVGVLAGGSSLGASSGVSGRR